MWSDPFREETRDVILMVRCECIRNEYTPFGFGGSPYRQKQCENEATVLVFGKTEAEKNTPPMPLCDECYAVFAERNPDYETEPITSDKCRMW